MKTYHDVQPKSSPPQIVFHRHEGFGCCLVVDSPADAAMALAIPGGHDVIEIRPDLSVHPTEERWDPQDNDLADELAEVFFFYTAVVVAVRRERVKDAVCYAAITRQRVRAADLRPEALARAYRNKKVSFSILAAMGVPWHTEFPGYEIWKASRSDRRAA